MANHRIEPEVLQGKVAVVRVSQRLWDRLRALAKRKDVSISTVIRDGLHALVIAAEADGVITAEELGEQMAEEREQQTA